MTSRIIASANTVPTLFQPSFTMSARWIGSLNSDQKYGALPALASANPERMAKVAAIIGCRSSRNCIGPVSRAARLSTTRVQKSSISSPRQQRRALTLKRCDAAARRRSTQVDIDDGAEPVQFPADTTAGVVLVVVIALELPPAGWK